MGLFDPKGEASEITTSLSIRELGQLLQMICADWKTSPEQLQSTSGALAAFDDRADIEIVISGKAGLLSPQIYVVQVYVWDLGDKREVQVIALGDNGLTKFAFGTKGAGKLSESIKRKDEIISRISAYK